MLPREPWVFAFLARPIDCQIPIGERVSPIRLEERATEE